jgi:hypothetical protein
MGIAFGRATIAPRFTAYDHAHLEKPNSSMHSLTL